MILEELLKASPRHQQIMFNALSVRDQLLTKINGVDLWLYMVELDMFYVMYRDGEGNVKTSSHHLLNNKENVNDPNKKLNRPLSDESQERWVNLIHDLSTDPTLPEEGYIDLDYKNHSRRIRSYYQVVKDELGNITCVVGNSEDISKTRSQMQQVIEEQNDYIRIINGLKSAYDTIVYIDLRDHNFKILEAPLALRELADNCPNAQVLAKNIIQRTMKPEFRERFEHLADLQEISIMLKERRYLAFEYQTIKENWIKLLVRPAEYNNIGELTHIILSTEIVDDEHRTIDQLKIRSEHDGLTGLFNRSAGVSRIEELLKKESGYLALFDCDKFKSINDTFGHLVGDKVLVVVALTLQKVFENQILFRLGGDEFVCYITDSYLSKKAEEGFDNLEVFNLLKQELQKVEIPEMLGRYPSISAGIAKADKDNPIAFDELYKYADISLYQCKKYGTINLTK